MLRRTLDGRYQLEFYDRFSVIKLRAEAGGCRMASSQVLNDADWALLFSAPRAACPQHGCVFLIAKDVANSREAQSNLCRLPRW